MKYENGIILNIIGNNLCAKVNLNLVLKLRRLKVKMTKKHWIESIAKLLPKLTLSELRGIFYYVQGIPYYRKRKSAESEEND